MKTEYPKKFEKIDDNTSRLRVPQGWIIRTVIISHGDGVGVHTFFMPDTMSNWQLTKGE